MTKHENDLVNAKIKEVSEKELAVYQKAIEREKQKVDLADNLANRMDRLE